MRYRLLLLALACASAACTPRTIVITKPAVAMQPIDPGQAWRDAATAQDAALIERTREAIGGAVGRAGPRRLAALGRPSELFEPDAGLDHPELPPGSYDCRIVRIEASGTTRAFPPQFCFVGGEPDKRQSFGKQTGSDLPQGWLFRDSDRRLVFLGALQRRPGSATIAYGETPERNLVGVAERIGPFRWRITLPRDGGSALWLYELTPVPADRQPK